MKPRRSRPMPFQDGDRLTQPEFHRLYEQMPGDTIAELIEGVVHLKGPFKRVHGSCLADLACCVGNFHSKAAPVEAAILLTTIIDEQNEFQPDVSAYVEPENGGRVRFDAEGFLHGVADVAFEVADDTVEVDLGPKRNVYRRAGVYEYVVVCPVVNQIHWFDFKNGNEIRPNANGIWKSRFLEGFWLDGPALLNGDGRKLLATVQAGLATPEHAAFAAELARRRTRK